MTNYFSSKLKYDWKIVCITIISTLLLIIERYETLTSWKPLDRTILYFFVPLIITLLFFRENPGNYGFQFGDWKIGLLITLLCLVSILPVIYLIMRSDPNMAAYYQPFYKTNFQIYAFFDLLGWEFLFRGWMTFSYVRKFGPEGLWLQAVPFAMAHISKPEIETLSTIFGGFVFGWIAWRTKSFLYPFIIHWAIFTYVIFAAGRIIG